MLVAKLIHQETDAATINANSSRRIALFERCFGVRDHRFELFPVDFPVLFDGTHLELFQN